MKGISLLILSLLPTAAADQGRHIATSFKFGDMVGTASSLSWIANRNPESLGPLGLELQKYDLPGSLPLLVESRLAAAKNGQSGRLPAISVREMGLIGPQIVGLIDAELELVRANPIMQETPSSLEQYYDAFWTLDAARNRLRELHATTSYWKAVTRRFPRRRVALLPESIRDHVAAESGAETHQQVEQLLNDLDQREMELRFARLILAASVLQQYSDLEQRILAAGCWREDSESLDQFLSAKERPVLESVNVSNSDLAAFVKARARAAKQRAGELTAKSEALTKALFWWVRARYGMGTELYGLAKPVPAGRSNDPGQVVMPAERPNPSDAMTQQSNSVPQFARRHHHSWAVGPRSYSYSISLERQVQRVPVLKGFR